MVDPSADGGERARRLRVGLVALDTLGLGAHVVAH